MFKNHVYSVEQTDLVLPCSKTYRLDEKFVDTAENQPLKVRKPCPSSASPLEKNSGSSLALDRTSERQFSAPSISKHVEP